MLNQSLVYFTRYDTIAQVSDQAEAYYYVEEMIKCAQEYDFESIEAIIYDMNEDEYTDILISSLSLLTPCDERVIKGFIHVSCLYNNYPLLKYCMSVSHSDKLVMRMLIRMGYLSLIKKLCEENIFRNYEKMICKDYHSLLRKALKRGYGYIVDYLMSKLKKRKERRQAAQDMFIFAYQSGHLLYVKYIFDVYVKSKRERRRLIALDRYRCMSANSNNVELLTYLLDNVGEKSVCCVTSILMATTSVDIVSLVFDRYVKHKDKRVRCINTIIREIHDVDLFNCLLKYNF